jgi:hypothetical protein
MALVFIAMLTNIRFNSAVSLVTLRNPSPGQKPASANNSNQTTEYALRLSGSLLLCAWKGLSRRVSFER